NVNGQKSIVAVTALSNQYNLQWYFVSVLNSDVLQRNFIVLSWALAGVAVVCGVIALVLAIRVAHATTAPINSLSDKISSVDFSAKRGFAIGAEGDELYELERNYEEMLQRLFKLMEENKQNMETQRKLEMDALQMQINPHFLYNTLDAIAWMAKIKKQPDIEKLTINLAKFFRISLHKGDKYIKIKEETELIEHFLEIEKTRFPNTINYVCNLSDNIGEYVTLKLILQPIVENSIKHGFAGKEGVGTISISAVAERDDIVISVVDDGCGFDVTENFWTQKTDKPNGYGLYNVNERIRLEYGEGYGLEISSQKGVGTTVKVRIKKRL
ncbi:MAG: sensor histidine kinase, partial [Candidatus Fimimonas sp.]